MDSSEKMPREHYESIARLEDTYWWHQARFRTAVEVIKRSRGRLQDLRFADVGCGTGGFLRHLLRNGCRRIVGFDASAMSIELVAKSRIEAHLVDLERPPDFGTDRFDIMTALDVLEHLDTEGPLLDAMRRSIGPKGAAFFTVPAHPVLFSEWDRKLRHFRRYTRSSLVGLLERHGFRVIESSHVFAFAVPMAFARRWVGSFDGAESCEFPAVPAALDRLLANLGALERSWLRRGRTIPFGTSLYALAEPA